MYLTQDLIIPPLSLPERETWRSKKCIVQKQDTALTRFVGFGLE